jgi:hypothetical protein
MSLLDSPKNYNELLPRLNGATFLTTLALFIMLRIFNLVPYVQFNKALVPQLQKYKELIEWIVSSGVIPLIAAFVAFILSYVFEMHYKIAKLLLVRFFWDKYFIARPLAKRAKSEISLTSINVKRIMNELYYPKVKEIDQHYVQLFWRYALPFWILFEHALVVFATAIILSIVNRNASILGLWEYFVCIVIVTVLQLLLVTAPKSTDQADQLPTDTVNDFFNNKFN